MDKTEPEMKRKNLSRESILKAARSIVRKESWAGLSMRKISLKLGYSATMIYEYFKSKDALLIELTRLGFLELLSAMKDELNKGTNPQERLAGVWLAYWKFAFSEKETYKLMFGVGTSCQNQAAFNRALSGISAIVSPVIKEALPDWSGDSYEIECKYQAYWSAVHGLIALNFINKVIFEDLNRHLLIEMIRGITAAKIEKS